MRREICFDTETTGMDPEDGHRLVEIGCVELIDGRVTENSFHEYINPERDVPEEVVKVHGLTTEFLRDFKPFRDLAQKFVDYVGDSLLIAHNAGFDMKFINYELKTLGFDALQNEVLDTLEVSRHKFPGQKNTLDALCKRFNIDSSRRTKHGALLDAELLAEVYVALTGGSGNILNFEEEAKKIALSNEKMFKDILEKAKNSPIISKRDFPINEDEVKAHMEFIQNSIKNSIWNYNQNNQQN